MPETGTPEAVTIEHPAGDREAADGGADVGTDLAANGSFDASEAGTAEPDPDGPGVNVEPHEVDDSTLDGSAEEDDPSDGGDELPFGRPTAEQLPALAEALLFVSDGPVDPPALARALGVGRPQLDRALDTLAERLSGAGTRLQRGPDGVQLVTAPSAAAVVEHFLGLESNRRLSTAALETLAVIAYRQPVTRATVEDVRGVNSDAAIATLRARGLIDIGGRAPGPGRPLLFVTTQRFLEHFGITRLEELPELAALAAPSQPLLDLEDATLSEDGANEAIALDGPAPEPGANETGAASDSNAEVAEEAPASDEAAADDTPAASTGPNTPTTPAQREARTSDRARPGPRADDAIERLAGLARQFVAPGTEVGGSPGRGPSTRSPELPPHGPRPAFGG